MAHACCMLNRQGYTSARTCTRILAHTRTETYATYCFSTATMISRRRLNLALCVHCVSSLSWTEYLKLKGEGSCFGPRKVHTGSEAHTAFCSVDTGAPYPGVTWSRGRTTHSPTSSDEFVMSAAVSLFPRLPLRIRMWVLRWSTVLCQKHEQNGYIRTCISESTSVRGCGLYWNWLGYGQVMV